MRIYVPATVDELAAMKTSATQASWHVFPRSAHAVTPELTALLPDEDGEGVEFAAFLAAADGCVELLAAHPEAPRRRLVVTMEVPDDAVRLAQVVTEVHLTQEIEAPVVCVHVDEPEAAADVAAAVGELSADPGSVAAGAAESALDVLAERDMLWYDWSEISQIGR